MATRAYKHILLGTFLLGTTALVTPALAQTFDNQVNATALISTNNNNVLGIAAFGQPQIIQSGIANNIGAGATGALGIANVNQTISQSTVQQGANTQGGNSVVVQDISATNNTTLSAPTLPATANVEAIVDVNGLSIIGTPAGFNPIAATGGGIGNSIGATAVGAAASASIAQNFDTDTATDLTTLASNQVKAGTITATNTVGSVQALLNPGQEALIGDGIENSITARAAGASAAASIDSFMLDTTTASPGAKPIPGVATNVVKTGDISATNRDTVTAAYGEGNPQTSTGTTISTAQISNGIGNGIGAIASGASVSASVNQAIDYTTLAQGNTASFIPNAVYGNSVTTGSLTAFNSKDGTVTATLGIPQSSTPVPVPPVPILGATISDGISNTIAAQATGASAGGSIIQNYANVNAASAGGFPPQFAASNSVTTGAISAINHGDVSADAAVLPTLSPASTNASLISAGIGNTIGATASGASASLGITQGITTSTVLLTLPEDNTVKLNADGGMIARNGKNATVEASLTEYGATQIANGAGNFIGATAIGASTGANINQSMLGTTTDTTSFGNNTIIVKDTGTGNNAMVARNNGMVTATFQPRGVVGAATATISDGVANSISAQAVGASVNASITSRYDNSNVLGLSATPLPVNTIDTTTGNATGLLARNNGAVTATFGMPGNNAGDLQIVTGVANNIGASAAGAAASAGITQSVSFALPTGQTFNPDVATQSLFANLVKTGDITARNTGDVTSTLWSPGNATIGTAPSGGFNVGGVGNSISAQSVGASADASISSRFYNVFSTPSMEQATNTIKSGDLTADNTGKITATAMIGSSGPLPPVANASIYNGVGNFIGASAMGASANAGITQSVSSSVNTNFLAFDTTLLPPNSVTAGSVTATNSGIVNATLTVTSGTTQIGAAGAPISFSTGNVGNSIAAQAVGASASASITSQVFNTTIPQSTTLPNTLSTNAVKVASLYSSNSGPVTATANFAGGGISPVSINGGVGNMIGASATGASSSASINQVVSTSSTNTITPGNSISSLNTLAANSITVHSITAVNTGNVTATLNSVGPGSLNSGILGGVGNSISANAAGASVNVSIVQSIANSR